MRKLLLVLLLALVGAAGTYGLSPFRAAWQIREAMRAGDTATLAARVDWAGVRQTLKQTATETRQLIAEMSENGGEAKPNPGIWERIKSAAAPYIADPLIDRYVTAEGAPRLWALRQTWRQRVAPAVGVAEPPTLLSRTPLANTSLDRGLSLVRRVERAKFESPTRVVLELRDRFSETRRWRAVLELRERTWVMTEAHIVRTTPALTAARATRN